MGDSMKNLQNCETLDYWRKVFESTNGTIFDVIENAIIVAALDCPTEFRSRRDKIIETIYTPRSKACRCNRLSDGSLLPSSRKEEKERDKKVLKRYCQSNEAQKTIFFQNQKGNENSIILSENRENNDEKRVINEVTRIKGVLNCAENETENAVLDLLDQLRSLKLTANTLKVTSIESSVRNLRKRGSRKIMYFTESLLKSWDSIAAKESTKPKESGTDVLPRIHANDWLDFPPLDGETLLATYGYSTDLSKIFDGINEDGTIKSAEVKTEVQKTPCYDVLNAWTGDAELPIYDERPPKLPRNPVKASGLSDGDFSEKVKVTKNKLHEKHEEAEKLKKKPMTPLEEFHELPKPADNQRSPRTSVNGRHAHR